VPADLGSSKPLDYFKDEMISASCLASGAACLNNQKESLHNQVTILEVGMTSATDEE